MIDAKSTALVTGASSGIGEQFARKLAARGVNLVLVARSEVRLRDLAAELAEAGRDVVITVVVADLSLASAPHDIARELEAAGVIVDLLINNAGVGSLDLFANEDPDATMREIQLNCMSLVALTALFLRAFSSATVEG